MDLFGDIIGIGGMICILLGYFMIQRGRWASTGLPYLYTNLLGAFLLMGSLLIHWNMATFILEVVWACISIYGIIKYKRSRP